MKLLSYWNNLQLITGNCNITIVLFVCFSLPPKNFVFGIKGKNHNLPQVKSSDHNRSLEMLTSIPRGWIQAIRGREVGAILSFCAPTQPLRAPPAAA